MQKFSQYLTKAGSISPNAPVAIRADYFVHRAKEVHGDKYSYDPSVFISTKIKTQITCPEHGVFEQTPALHLAGRGCPKCKAGRGGKDPAIAIQELANKFPALDFSNSIYRGSLQAISFVCPEHGEQVREYHLLLKGESKGCTQCSRDKSSTAEEMLKRIKEVHGEKYIYNSMPNKVTGDTHTTITCRDHGEFSQQLRKHLEGQGCPSCGKRNSNVLYLLKHPKEPIYKVGVTSSHRAHLRYLANIAASNLELETIRTKETENPLLHEKFLLSTYTNNPYAGEEFVGHTEYRLLTNKEVDEVLYYFDNNV